ncbi:MAG: hypothetical protein HYX76_00265 [Acidobacteria bacterium]|nr:hypothetical protein [Acidobacteriota bacterium]
MSDPLLTVPRDTAAEASATRDSKIEQLLLLGLDEYLAGAYDQAINVWTRVLFLDRGHARARAYIERARSALAERQRESEELLHRGVAAFDRGDANTARELLNSSVARGGPQEVALVLLDRLDRLETAAGPSDGARLRRRGAARRGEPEPLTTAADRRRWTVPILLMSCVMLAAAAGAAFWDRLAPMLSVQRPGSAAAAVPAAADEALPVPPASEVVLARARTLFERGRLRESWQVLEAIKPGDILSPDADALRARIQLALLSALEPAAPTVSPSEMAPLIQR